MIRKVNGPVCVAFSRNTGFWQFSYVLAFFFSLLGRAPPESVSIAAEASGLCFRNP